MIMPRQTMEYPPVLIFPWADCPSPRPKPISGHFAEFWESTSIEDHEDLFWNPEHKYQVTAEYIPSSLPTCSAGDDTTEQDNYVRLRDLPWHATVSVSFDSMEVSSQYDFDWLEHLRHWWNRPGCIRADQYVIRTDALWFVADPAVNRYERTILMDFYPEEPEEGGREDGGWTVEVTIFSKDFATLKFDPKDLADLFINRESLVRVDAYRVIDVEDLLSGKERIYSRYITPAIIGCLDPDWDEDLERLSFESGTRTVHVDVDEPELAKIVEENFDRQLHGHVIVEDKQNENSEEDTMEEGGAVAVAVAGDHPSLDVSSSSSPNAPPSPAPTPGERHEAEGNQLSRSFWKNSTEVYFCGARLPSGIF